MNKFFKYIGCILFSGLALAACSPEEFAGADKSGLPTMDGRQISVETDQETNTAVFTLSGDFKGCYPVWYLDGKIYSLLPTASYHSMEAGTHTLEAKLMNRNGQSQAAANGSFTFNETKVDYTPYFNKLCDKEWRIDYAEKGHMGCGPTGTDGSEWWSADVNNKADWGVYDDRIYFTHSDADGVSSGFYSYNPGEGGTVYVNTGCTIFSEYNTNDEQDFMAPVSEQKNVSFTLVPGTYNDEECLYIQFAPQTILPYIANDAMYNNPYYRIEALTNNRLVLIADEGSIAWRLMFTSKEDTGLPDEPEIPGATFDWDYDATSNMWKAVDNGDSRLNITTWFANDSWTGLENQPEVKATGDGYEVVVPEGTGGSQWQGQIGIHTNLTAKGDKKYNFYCLVDADNDVPGMTIKLTESDVSDSEKHDDNFFADRHEIIGSKQHVYKAEGVTLAKGTDAHALSLVLDLGGTPAGTKVKISKIYFEQDNTVGYDDDANMWKAVDNGSSFLNFETWFANNDWAALDPQPEIKHDGNAYTFTVPEGTGSSQWQGQLKIHTNLTAELTSTYNFSCKMEMDNDAQGVTIKLTEDGDDNNFFFGDRHNVTADKAFVYSAKGVTLPINDAKALMLVLDFGGTPGGTNVKVSEIVFSKAE